MDEGNRRLQEKVPRRRPWTKVDREQPGLVVEGFEFAVNRKAPVPGGA